MNNSFVKTDLSYDNTIENLVLWLIGAYDRRPSTRITPLLLSINKLSLTGN